MDQVMEIFNKYKAYIVRGVVGAVLATVLWALDLPIWINGAIIALVAGIASDFVQKQLDVQLENLQAAKETAQDEVEEAVETVVDTAKKATRSKKIN